MSLNATDPQPESLPAKDAPRARSAETHGQPGGLLDRSRWLVALWGLIAGLAAFVVGEATYNLIPAQQVMAPRMSGGMMPTVTAETQSVADARNGALASGVLGACLGGCLGIAGGLARRSPTAALTAGLFGSMLGTALTAGVSVAILRFFENARLDHLESELIISMVMHGMIWGLGGATAGLALSVGMGLRRWYARAMAAGLAGAVLGGIAFDLIGGALFPLADTLLPISTTWPSRLTGRLLVAAATAASLILVLPKPRPAESERHPEVPVPPTEP